MKEHLLIEKAFIYPLPKNKPSLPGCIFDNKNGYWITEDQQQPFVYDKRMVGPRSKKADIETGEDHKGE